MIDFTSTNQIDYNEIGRRIATERKMIAKSQDDFCDLVQNKLKKMNLGRSTLSAWETGKSLPDMYELLELCIIFGCDPGYLLGEYDCHTRQATDIHRETGLSEDAINFLKYLHSLEGEEIKATLSFISDLLVEPCFECAIRYFLNAKKIQKSVTKRDEKIAAYTQELLNSGIERKDLNKLRTEYMSMLDQDISQEFNYDIIELGPIDAAEFYSLAAKDKITEAFSNVMKNHGERR